MTQFRKFALAVGEKTFDRVDQNSACLGHLTYRVINLTLYDLALLVKLLTGQAGQ